MGFYNKDPVFGTSGVSQSPKKKIHLRGRIFFSRGGSGAEIGCPKDFGGTNQGGIR